MNDDRKHFGVSTLSPYPQIKNYLGNIHFTNNFEYQFLNMGRIEDILKLLQQLTKDTSE